MPVMVPIPCHTRTCFLSVDYACGPDNPKVLARDSLNLAEELGGALAWWRQMDQLREAAGVRPRMRTVLDEDGKPVPGPDGEPLTYDSTVYYEHLILSPDPADSPTLEQVRAVALAWAAEQFPGFQVAIGYHCDTDVLHAHLIVNGVDLGGHRRVTDVTRGQWCRRAWARLQEIARENGLSGFRGDDGGEGGEEEARLRAELAEYERSISQKRQDGPAGKEGGQMRERGAYSWVEDVRSRAECAARISSDEAQFRRALGALRVSLTRSRSGGWMYELEGERRHRVTGRRLGPRWTERGVAQRLAQDARGGARKPAPAAFDALVGVLAPLMDEGARGVRYVGLVEAPEGPEGRQRLVEDVAEMASWLGREGVASLAGLDALGPLGGREAELAGLARSLGWLPREDPPAPPGSAQRADTEAAPEPAAPPPERGVGGQEPPARPAGGGPQAPAPEAQGADGPRAEDDWDDWECWDPRRELEEDWGDDPRSYEEAGPGGPAPGRRV